MLKKTQEQQKTQKELKCEHTKMCFLPSFGQATSPAEERQDVTILYSKMTLGELQSTYSFNVSQTWSSVVAYMVNLSFVCPSLY